jgi:Putative Flp pilus-assembly TadE/G-like
MKAMRTRVGILLGRVSAPLAVFTRAEAGAAAVYVALVFPAFIGAGGLAVDVASWYSTERTMQSGADAAAYAAALEFARQGLDQAPDLDAMQAVADDAASRNGVGTTVTLNVPPLSGPAAGDAQSVEIIVTEPAPVYFASMFLNAPPVITTRAVAKAVVSDACIWALHPSAKGALTISGSANVDLNCGVVVNSNDPDAALGQSGTSCLSATSISINGGYSGDCVSPEPEVSMPNYGDPLSSLVEPSFGGCDFNVKVNVSSGQTATLTPGVYCKGIALNGTAVFEPGLYVLDGGSLEIQSSAIVTNNENASGGVTFYLTGSGSKYASVSVSSGSQVTLTPMTTGPLANVLFFQDRDAKNGQSKLTGQSQMNLTGMIYFPNSEVEFTGGSAMDEADVLLVASTLKISGNTYLNADYAQSLLPEQYYARFVE